MFQSDKPLGRVLNLFADQLILNMLFLLGCIPVVTAGASAISLYEQEYAIWESREDLIVRSFFRGILRNFKKGLILELILVLTVVVGLGIWASAVLVGLPVRLSACITAVLLGGIYFWVLGLTGRYEQKMGLTFRNGYLLAFREFPYTLLLVLVNLGYPALFLVLPEELFSGYLFAALFFYSAAAACLSAKIMLLALNKLNRGAD